MVEEMKSSSEGVQVERRAERYWRRREGLLGLRWPRGWNR